MGRRSILTWKRRAGFIFLGGNTIRKREPRGKKEPEERHETGKGLTQKKTGFLNLPLAREREGQDTEVQGGKYETNGSHRQVELKKKRKFLRGAWLILWPKQEKKKKKNLNTKGANLLKSPKLGGGILGGGTTDNVNMDRAATKRRKRINKFEGEQRRKWDGKKRRRQRRAVKMPYSA